MDKSYSWLFFDADDTLFDYYAAENSALQRAFSDLGLAYSPQALSAYQRINRQIWVEFEAGSISSEALRVERFRRLFAELALDAPAERCSQIYLPYLSEGSMLVPGALDLLQAVNGRYRLALITNGLSDVQRPRLHRAGITPYFDGLFISEEMGVAKPEPAYFDLALARCGNPSRAEVLVIGDSLSSDIRGGYTSGLDTCWYNPRQLAPDPRWPPTYTLSRLSDLLVVLNSAA